MNVICKCKTFPLYQTGCRLVFPHIHQWIQRFSAVPNHCRATHRHTRYHIRTVCVDHSLYRADQFAAGEVTDTDESEHRLSNKIESIARDIADGASSRVGELGTMSERKIAETIRTLVMNGLPQQVVGCITDCPQVLYKTTQLLDLLQAFKEIGLTTNKIIRMVKNHPDVLKYKKEELFSAFHTLMALGFTSDIIVEVVVKHPVILKTDLSRVGSRIEELKLFFNTQHTFKLVKNNPRLLFCDMDEIRSKFVYVYNHMGVTQPQMMHSGVFNYSLEHIHARHMFVVRAGFFKEVKLKDKFNNPKLDAILDTTDAAFAMKFGKMTEQDYLCFKKLLLKEELLTMISKGQAGTDYNYEDDDMLEEEEELTDDE